jgi:hypothetical protein
MSFTPLPAHSTGCRRCRPPRDSNPLPAATVISAVATRTHTTPRFTGFRDTVRAVLIYCAVSVSGLVIGLAVAVTNAALALRVTVGFALAGLWLVYPFFLLLSWATLDPLIGTTVPLVNGSNFNTNLTIPTLLLLFTIPVRQTLRTVPGIALYAALLVWMLPGLAFSPLDKVTFIQQWTLYLDQAAVALLVILLVSTRERFTLLINVVLAVVAGIAIFGIFSYLLHPTTVASISGNSVGSTGRLRSVYAAGPTAALVFSNAVPLAAFRALSGRPAERLFGLFCTVILLLATALTFTRGAFVSLAIDFFVALLLLRGTRARFWLLFSGALFIMAGAFSGFSFLSRFTHSDISTFDGRLILWRVLISNFSPAELFGKGLDSSFFLLQQIAASKGIVAAVTNGSNAQNLYVTVLYDHGVIGLIFLIGSFVVFGLTFARRLRWAAGEYRVLLLAALVTLVNTMVLSFEGSDLFGQAIGLDFWIIMVLPFAAYWQHSSPEPEPSRGAVPGNGTRSPHPAMVRERVRRAIPGGGPPAP